MWSTNGPLMWAKAWRAVIRCHASMGMSMPNRRGSMSTSAVTAARRWPSPGVPNLVMRGSGWCRRSVPQKVVVREWVMAGGIPNLRLFGMMPQSPSPHRWCKAGESAASCRCTTGHSHSPCCRSSSGSPHRMHLLDDTFPMWNSCCAVHAAPEATYLTMAASSLLSFLRAMR